MALKEGSLELCRTLRINRARKSSCTPFSKNTNILTFSSRQRFTSSPGPIPRAFSNFFLLKLFSSSSLDVYSPQHTPLLELYRELCTPLNSTSLFLKFETMFGRRYTPNGFRTRTSWSFFISGIRPQHREKHIIIFFLHATFLPKSCISPINSFLLRRPTSRKSSLIAMRTNLSSRFVCSIFMLHTMSISPFDDGIRRPQFPVVRKKLVLESLNPTKSGAGAAAGAGTGGRGINGCTPLQQHLHDLNVAPFSRAMKCNPLFVGRGINGCTPL